MPNETTGKLISIGTDIIECVRIAQMIEKHGEVFLQRVFTQKEILYCSSRKAATQHYAGRWAAKEAVLKVLGTGWTKGIQWTDVEIVNDRDADTWGRAMSHPLCKRACRPSLDRRIESQPFWISLDLPLCCQL